MGKGGSWQRVERTIAGVLLALPLTVLVGCTTPSAPPVASTSPSTSTSPTASGKKLAVLLSGPASDNSWNEAAATAVATLKQKGIDAVSVESVAVPDAERLLRQYADQGYALVVAHGFQYRDAVFKVAKEYPKVNFAWAGGINGTAANVADYAQPFYQGAYVVGLVGAKLSKSGKLGALYGFDVPACHSMGQAMLKAAQTTKPTVTLTETAVGDWGDVAKAKEATLAQADAGVDYWIACGQGPALGAIEGAKAKKAGYTTGYVGDMAKLAPDAVAASIVWNMVPVFEKMLADVDSGKFANQYYQFGIPEGVITVAVNPALKSKLGDAATQAIAQTQAQIASGKLKVPFMPK